MGRTEFATTEKQQTPQLLGREGATNVPFFRIIPGSFPLPEGKLPELPFQAAGKLSTPIDR